jgi:hypothetical protein
MSALTPEALVQLALQAANSGLATLLGALAGILLLVLVIEREALRAFGEPYASRGRVLNLAIVPLLVVFGAVIFEHFIRLIFL